jgi:glycosyltransferase involved in cell wall biosynthesis
VTVTVLQPKEATTQANDGCSRSPFPIKQPPLETVPLGEMPRNPLVSVIVPSYNQGRFIRATLDSVLEQDYRPIEIVVIDGASTDETRDVLGSYEGVPELTWISEPDSGVVEAVNKGFARVRGDVVAIQSSDDRYLTGAIRKMVETFRKNKDCGLIYGDTVKVDENGRELSRYRIGPWSLENLFLLKTWIPQPSCFFRRELLDACGGWDERIPYAPDTDLWIRMAFRTQVMKLDDYLSQRRIHDEQRDTQAGRVLGDYRKMIEQSADIAAQPATTRSAARAGSELLYRRYNPSGSELQALRHDLKAAFIDRRAFNARRTWSNAVVIPLRKRLQPLAPAKRWLGCWMNERWRTEVALSPVAKLMGMNWRDLCNRHEKVKTGDDPVSRHVETEHTSYLTVSKLFPAVGGRIARRCFAEYPLPDVETTSWVAPSEPVVSIILPVGGEDRLQNFRSVLNCLLNQSVAGTEIIVLEHSPRSVYKAGLPQGVRYRHVAKGDHGEEFNKSRLFNLGVSMASTDSVLLHDADILVPKDYLDQSLGRIEMGYEAVRPIRFLFYATGRDTDRLRKKGQFDISMRFIDVAQNFQGGSTLLRRSVYSEIGGHDESFIAWRAGRRRRQFLAATR